MLTALGATASPVGSVTTAKLAQRDVFAANRQLLIGVRTQDTMQNQQQAADSATEEQLEQLQVEIPCKPGCAKDTKPI